MYELSKDRYLELKHHCSQYPEWRKEYGEKLIDYGCKKDIPGEVATRMTWLENQMEAVVDTAYQTVGGPARRRIFDAIINGRKPEPRDEERYRKFFWLLDKKL